MSYPAADVRRQLIQAARRLDRLTLQRSLMRATDRELAIACGSLQYSQRQHLLACISPGRLQRIKEEISYHSTLRISDRDYQTIMRRMLAYLSSGPPPPLRGYVRPVSRRRPRL